jgi:hypothetical protein
VLEWPAQLHRIVPRLFETFSPIIVQRVPSFGSLTSGVGAGVGVEVDVDVGLTIATPLFQTNFFPDLMQE